MRPRERKTEVEKCEMRKWRNSRGEEEGECERGEAGRF